MSQTKLPELSGLSNYDPYDLWATDLGVKVRKQFYSGKLMGKLGAISIAVVDWLIPGLSRKWAKTETRIYPISFAHWVLCQTTISQDQASQYLDILDEIAAVNNEDTSAWGLGFNWMSKNGLYGTDIPFVTHTPYVMEALLHIANRCPEASDRALASFDRTLDFMRSLVVMRDTNTELVLSYAPLHEPRMVVNANAYAAFAYSLHTERKKQQSQSTDEIENLVKRLVVWIINQQKSDGCWFYYADEEPGNFIDCFHTCFVIKNLLRVAKLQPNLEELITPAVELGARHLAQAFTSESGLMNRFTVRDIKDPFVYDLYDQAEYLGVLIDLGQFDEAKQFSDLVQDKFSHDGELYCKLDFLKRKWGKGFLRWGILPFLYQQHRLVSRGQT